jgi:hypothetical protein
MNGPMTIPSARRLLATALVAAAAGCGTTQHQLTLMPRDSGKLYQGVAEDSGGSEGPIVITIENRTYTGTWVEVVPERTYGYVTGGYGGYGARAHGWGLGGSVTMDNPSGGRAKALLQSADGAGLRCDFLGGGGRAGGGVCRDDKGLEYDVQIRASVQK